MRPLLPALTCALALASLACSQRHVFTPVDESESTGADEAGSSSSDSESSTDAATSESEDTGTPPDMGMSCPPDPPPPDEIPPAPEGCEQVYLWSCESGELSETPAGWIGCGEGSYPDEYYRREPVACIHEHSLPACTDGDGSCTSDADCDGNQRCLQNYGYCYCRSPNCMSDADCGPDELCLCAAGVDGYSMNWRNHCVPADCRSQADCGDDPQGCRIGRDVCGQPANAHCPTPADDCSVDADCPNGWCRWDDTDMLWTCDQPAICE